MNTKFDFTRAEAIEAFRELYADWREMKAREEGLESIRMPDFEAMLDQIEESGIPEV